MKNFKSRTTFNFKSILFGAFALCIFVVSCSQGDFKSKGQKEDNPKQDNATPIQQVTPPVPIARSVYEMKIVAKTGTQLCSGTATFILSDQFDLSPTGSITCLIGGTLDLAQLFGSSNAVERVKENMSQYKDAGRVQRVANPVNVVAGTASFQPPRPFMLGPVIQDPNIFKDFVFREASTVNGIARDGTPFQDTGEFYIQVNEVGLNFVPEGYTGKTKFPSVIRWEMKATGFKNSPRLEFMAFDSLTYWFNTQPDIAVPRIQIEAKFSDIAGSLGDGAAAGISKTLGDSYFSGVDIIFNIREYNKL